MAVTLITGASSGIGYSLARRMAAAGDAVAVLARRGERLGALVEEIERAGGRALAVTCDVTDRAGVLAAVRDVEAELGPIDRLVANAGGGKPTFVDGFSAEQIERTLALNVVGVANCIEAVLPGMLARGAGHLIATSSLAAYRGLPTGAAYSAAKAALTALMESLRLDLRGRGVDVTVVFPGPVRLKAASKKSRLVSMDVERAAERIHRAILRRKPLSAFPLHVSLIASLGRWLPVAVYDRLLAGRGRKPKESERSASHS